MRLWDHVRAGVGCLVTVGGAACLPPTEPTYTGLFLDDGSRSGYADVHKPVCATPRFYRSTEAAGGIVVGTRREFLTGVAAASLLTQAAAQEKPSGSGIPTRPLGTTGINVSIVCLGGWHIGSIRED
jgi:hypothetical protein